MPKRYDLASYHGAAIALLQPRSCCSMLACRFCKQLRARPFGHCLPLNLS